jgi:hypothetical protein
MHMVPYARKQGCCCYMGCVLPDYLWSSSWLLLQLVIHTELQLVIHTELQLVIHTELQLVIHTELPLEVHCPWMQQHVSAVAGA